MPAFDTPGPISATLDIVVGDVRITAGDRADTIVTVRAERRRPTTRTARRPSRPASSSRAASCWSRRRSALVAPRSRGGSIDVTIELPAGLARCTATRRWPTSPRRAGSASAGSRPGLATSGSTRPGSLSVKTGVGDVTADRAPATPRSRPGPARSAWASSTQRRDQELQRRHLDRRGRRRPADQRGQRQHHRRPAHASVVAKTANGDVRLGEVERGAVVLETALGDLEVGIPEGIAAWLDLNTAFGNVHNALEAAGAPEPSAETVEVRARSAFGDITIRRAGGRGMTPAIRAEDVRARVRRRRRARRPRPRGRGRNGVRPARARTAPARRRSCACSRRCCAPTAGRASVLGHDVVAEPLAVRRRIGLAGQFAAVDEELTGRENLEMIGRLYRLAPAPRRAARAPRCSTASGSPTPPTAASPPTPAACAAGSTSARASSAARR